MRKALGYIGAALAIVLGGGFLVLALVPWMMAELSGDGNDRPPPLSTATATDRARWATQKALQKLTGTYQSPSQRGTFGSDGNERPKPKAGEVVASIWDWLAGKVRTGTSPSGGATYGPTGGA